MSDRNCVRCGKDLEDASSLEAGIGPVCRKLDNAIFAARIPAQLDVARDALRSIDKEMLPEECWLVYRQVCAAINGPSRREWREVVKQIEWLCSWLQPFEAALFHGVVLGLGYVGLVSLWKGEAASGRAEVWLAEERIVERQDGSRTVEKGAFLFVAGPKNTAARFAIKKLQGRRFHPKQQLARKYAAWSVPAAEAEAFKLVVLAHYPNHEVQGGEQTDGEGGWDTVLAAAKLAVKQLPLPSADKKSEVEIIQAGDWILVKSPYNAQFVRDVKALPYEDRKWSQQSLVWQVSKKHEAVVRGLVSRYYGAVS